MVDEWGFSDALFYERPEGAAGRRRIIDLIACSLDLFIDPARIAKVYRTTARRSYFVDVPMPVEDAEPRPWEPRYRWEDGSLQEPPSFRIYRVALKQLGDTGILVGSWEVDGKIRVVVNDAKSKVELWEPGEGP